ncbi:MAG: HAD family hydrolase [Propionibacteriales bacterium]|nr:HAD family hydrolase [Propionibacteriales bacterium]
MTVVRLAMWSGPRNVSTALMRSWENRPDCAVVDEPLYAYYLQWTGIDHPVRDEVIASQPAELDAVVASLLGPAPGGAEVFYQKHMTHHLLPETDRSWIAGLTNVLLIRDPREVVASYLRSRSSVEPADIGIPQQLRLYDKLVSSGDEPPVVDAGDFLRDPESYLRWLCAWVDVEFTDRMLSWPPGPRDSDGVWAPHWYDAVWRSTGFEPWRPRNPVLEGHPAEVAAACADGFAFLHGRRVRL